MKLRQSISLVAGLAMIAALVACGGTSTTMTTPPPPPTPVIAATSGAGQTATVSTAFAMPLVATVTTGGTATSGVTVTFTAPASGASGTFANGTATTTAVTNSSGVATSSTFTANSTAGTISVTASAPGATASASFSLTSTAEVVAITATSGTPQTATISTAFATQLGATVTTGGTPTSGVTVTFTAPATGASGTFANGTATTTAVTNSSGVATASTFTANATAGTFTVSASAPGATTSASFSLTSTAAPVVAIAATSGTPQTATVSTAFATKLGATVTTGGVPTSGVTVTFTAPATGASGTFANGTATTTAVTNSSGVATSSTFTANATTGTYNVTASATGITTPADFSLTNAAAITVSLSGVPTSLVAGATAMFSATTNDTAGVTWTCAPSGACGSFNPTSTLTTVDTAYTAPSAVPSGNKATVTATSVTDITKSASADITITAITVSLSGVPSSLATSATAMFSATTNDTAGVAWTCTPSGACGSFNPTSTLTTVDTTYTAPSAVPSGGKVTVIATSVTDSSKSASAKITITGTTLGAGSYVFSLLGTDANGVYSVAGVFSVNSSGAITGGEQDYVNTVDNFPHDSISSTGSSITATTDGNLLITLNTGDTSIGNGGIEVLDASVISPSKALIVEYDTARVSSGELDLQTTPVPTSVSGNYVFLASGWDSGKAEMGLAGTISIGSGGTISTANSIFDLNIPPAILDANETLSSGSVGTPDTFGRVVFSMTPTDTTIKEFSYVGYIIDSSDIRLVEGSDQLGGTTGGDAFAQSASPTFTGSFVFGAVGADGNGELQAAGILTAGASSAVTGDIAFNDSSTQSVAGGTAVSGGTYAAPDAFGRVIMTGVADNPVTYTYDLNLYLTGSGKAILLSMDSTNVLSGLAYTQTTGTLNAASFSGNYVLGEAQLVPANLTTTLLGQQGAVGVVGADGTSTLSGFLDVNANGSLKTDKTLAGTFASGSTNGVLTGTTTDPVTGNTDNFTYFQISTSSVIGIELDADQLTLGNFELQ